MQVFVKLLSACRTEICSKRCKNLHCKNESVNVCDFEHFCRLPWINTVHVVQWFQCETCDSCDTPVGCSFMKCKDWIQMCVLLTFWLVALCCWWWGVQNWPSFWLAVQGLVVLKWWERMFSVWLMTCVLKWCKNVQCVIKLMTCVLKWCGRMFSVWLTICVLKWWEKWIRKLEWIHFRRWQLLVFTVCILVYLTLCVGAEDVCAV